MILCVLNVLVVLTLSSPAKIAEAATRTTASSQRGLMRQEPRADLLSATRSDAVLLDQAENAQNSVSSLLSDIKELSEAEYGRMVLKTGAADIMTRWARRGVSIHPEVYLDGQEHGPNRPQSVGPGLYERVQDRIDELKQSEANAEPELAECKKPDYVRQWMYAQNHLSSPPGGYFCNGNELEAAESGRKLPTAEVVVSAFDSDVSWLSELNLPVSVYVHNSSAERSRCITNGQHCVGTEKSKAARLEKAIKSQRWLQQFAEGRSKNKGDAPVHFVDIPNIGDEALAYFSHIIAHYHSLPDYVYFVHDHQCSWHAKFDMASVVRKTLPCIARLNEPERGLSQGYLNLNDGPGGGPPVHQCFNTVTGHRTSLAQTEHLIAETPAADQRGLELGRVWDQLFKPYMGELPARYCMDCCAQFVVSKQRLKSHPLDFYHKQLEAVKTGKTSYEYFWRMLFVDEFE